MKKWSLILLMLVFCFKISAQQPMNYDQEAETLITNLNANIYSMDLDDIISAYPQIYTVEAIKGLINRALIANEIEIARDYLAKAFMIMISPAWKDTNEELQIYLDGARTTILFRPQELLLTRLKLLYSSSKLRKKDLLFEKNLLKVSIAQVHELKEYKYMEWLYLTSIDTLSLILDQYLAKMEDPEISLLVFGTSESNFEDGLLFNANQSQNSTNTNNKLMLFRLALLSNNDFISVGASQVPILDFFRNNINLASFFIGESSPADLGLDVPKMCMDKITPEDFIKYEAEQSLISLQKGLENYERLRVLIKK